MGLLKEGRINTILQNVKFALHPTTNERIFKFHKQEIDCKNNSNLCRREIMFYLQKEFIFSIH